MLAAARAGVRRKGHARQSCRLTGMVGKAQRHVPCAPPQPSTYLECIMSIHIRPERPEDFTAIREVVRLAFETAEHSDGDEHQLVERLRASAEYIPELALVAEEQCRIVGHILFTRLAVGEKGVALALAPLSVLPSWQGKGVGGALVRRGHELARALGWECAIVLGHADYYPRFGYQRASTFGILSPFEVPDEAFMAINLQGRDTSLPGMVAYSPAFFPDPAV